MEETNKQFKILGFSIWRLLAYFIIYSFLGYVIESCYCVITKGVLESRQSFLYGPFCGIYGIGAVLMILSLQYFKKNKYTLFFGGFLVGSIVEYALSFLGELIYNIKWWDYSNRPFNINGRICIGFSFFWGILAIYLVAHFHPKIDKFIDKIKGKNKIITLRILTLICTIALFIDYVLTGFALIMFYSRTVDKFDLKLANNQNYSYIMNIYNNNEIIREITDIFFNDKKMLRTFPNLKLTAEDGSIIYMDSLYPDIQTYYIKFSVLENK